MIIIRDGNDNDEGGENSSRTIYNVKENPCLESYFTANIMYLYMSTYVLFSC